MVRYRKNDWLELRVGWSGATFDKLTDEWTGAVDHTTTLANPFVGARLSVLDQNGLVPRTAVTLSNNIRLDGETTLANRFNPTASTGYSWLLDDAWLLSGSTGVSWISNVDGDRNLAVQQGVSVDYFLNSKVGIYAEWFTTVVDGNWKQYAGPGASCQLTDGLSIGASGYAGLNAAAEDVTLLLNLTYRP